MLEFLSLISLLAGFGFLIILSKIDLETYLLPNELVTAFLACGMVFHMCTVFHYANVSDMALGGVIGFLSLYLIRFIANKIYKQDTLGLGDVKLLGAAGVWLGPYNIMVAMTLGAVLGLLHGLAYAFIIRKSTGVFPHLASLKIPAGPGFAGGIIIAGIVMYYDFPQIISYMLSK